MVGFSGPRQSCQHVGGPVSYASGYAHYGSTDGEVKEGGQGYGEAVGGEDVGGFGGEGGLVQDPGCQQWGRWRGKQVKLIQLRYLGVLLVR